MGGRPSDSVPLFSSALVARLARSHVASNEGHEGDEGCWCQEGGTQGHDGNSSLQLGGLQHWFEGEGREGRRDELHVGCSGAVEEERILQVRGCVELEVEEEACDASSQGNHPIHQRTMCLQGETCVAD